MKIELLNQFHKKELLEFEIRNKDYFEKTCLPRGEKYYEESNFNNIIDELVAEQGKGLHYMYVIKNSEKRIVGRINLVDIVKGPFNKGEVGYRIGEEFIGNGYAKEAMKLVLEEAINKYKIHRLEAGVSIENISSQKVLEKSGFKYIGTYEKYIYLNGSWQDNMIFEKILD